MDKTHMSLDEIIKLNKNTKARNAAKNKTATPKKAVGGAARAAAGRRTFPAKGRAFQNKNITTKKMGRKVLAANRDNNAGGVVPTAVVKKIVNSAVKRALTQSRMEGGSGAGIAARLGGKIPRNIVSSGRLAQISARSRVIGRNRPALNGRVAGARVIRQAVQQPVQYQDVYEEVAAPPPVRIISQPPPQVVQIVEAPARSVQYRANGRQQQQRVQQQRVMVVPARQANNIQRGRIVRQAAVQRVVQQRRPQVVRQPRQVQQVIYEDDEPVQRVQVVRRQQNAPARQRVQVVRQQVQRPQGGRQSNVQYVEYVQGGGGGNGGRAMVQKNNNMRAALGLGGGRQTIIRESPRFEPSSSFLSRRTIVKRGRGFDHF